MRLEKHHSEGIIEAKKEQLASLRRALAMVEQQRDLRDIPYKSARALDSHFIGIAPIDSLDERAGRLTAQIKKLEAELA